MRLKQLLYITIILTLTGCETVYLPEKNQSYLIETVSHGNVEIQREINISEPIVFFGGEFPQYKSEILDDDYLLSDSKYNRVFKLTNNKDPRDIYVAYINVRKSNKGTIVEHEYLTFIPNQFIVTTTKKVSIGYLKDEIRKRSKWINEKITIQKVVNQSIYIITVQSDNLIQPQGFMNILSSIDNVDSVELDHINKLQVFVNQYQLKVHPNQWSFHNRGIPFLQGGKFDEDMDALDTLSMLESKKWVKYPSIVAVIDSGILKDHPALKDVIWKNKNEIPNNNKDDDGNGFIDDINGWNFEANNNNINDNYGHGTFISGLISGKPVSPKYFYGLSPHTKILPLKISDSKRVSISKIIQAFGYALDKEISIINMSFSSTTRNNAFESLIMKALEKDITMVSAAGNDAIDISKTPYYPCAYAGQLCVGSTDKFGNLATFSNYSSNTSQLYGVDILAPGQNVYSTSINGGYSFDSGTSYSAPYVAATAALLKTLHPNMSALNIRLNILQSATREPKLANFAYKGNKLNTFRSVWQPGQLPRHGVHYCDTKSPVTGQIRSRTYPFANSGEKNVDGLSDMTAFTICTAQQFKYIDNLGMDNKYYSIKRDLDWDDLPRGSHYPIPTNAKSFTGSINGNNHSIRNFKFDEGLSGTGFIKTLGQGGKIRRLRLIDLEVKGHTNVGGLVGVNEGEIDHVTVEGIVEGKQNIGGIVGRSNGGSITNAFFEGKIKSEYVGGGIVGYATNLAHIYRSHFQGHLDGSTLGGIAGKLSFHSSIKQSHASVISVSDSNIGGLASIVECFSVVQDSFSEGVINDGQNSGGAISIIRDASTLRTYSNIYLSGGNNGGFVAKKDDALMRGIGGNNDWVYVCTNNDTRPPASKFIESYYKEQLNPPGVGGIPASNYELRNKNTFRKWDLRDIWLMRPGFTPALRVLKRSNDG